MFRCKYHRGGPKSLLILLAWSLEHRVSSTRPEESSMRRVGRAAIGYTSLGISTRPFSAAEVCRNRSALKSSSLYRDGSFSPGSWSGLERSFPPSARTAERERSVLFFVSFFLFFLFCRVCRVVVVWIYEYELGTLTSAIGGLCITCSGSAFKEAQHQQHVRDNITLGWIVCLN